MKILGKIYLFVENVKGEKGTFKNFSCNVSHKNEDKTYLNKRVKVVFDKEEFKGKVEKLEVTKCYEVDVLDGWLDVRSYLNKDKKEVRELYFYIAKATVLSSKDIKIKEAIDTTLPF